MSVLTTNERESVIWLEASEPAEPGEAAARLGYQLADACVALEERAERPLAVVLRGGLRGFWLRPPRNAAECDAAGPGWAEAAAAIDRLSLPTIAVLEGEAIGPAWELALACDLRLAAADARVGSPEVAFGRLPAAGGTQRLTRLAGPAVALRLLLLGDVLAASDALALGLVHRVAPAAELDRQLEDLLAALRRGAPIALAYAREAVRAAADLPLAAGLRLEADLSALLQTTHDRAEGIDAFLERRPPRFEGR